MKRMARYLGQGAVYLLFAAVLGYFSTEPSYRHHDPAKAMIKLSFTHGAKAKGECHRRSPEELAKLAPNMRRPVVCPRERMAVAIELTIDGQRLVSETLRPTGLSRDGPSYIYRRFVVEPGRHRLQVMLRDSARTSGFDYVAERTVDLAPAQNLSIDFDSRNGGFVFE